MPYARHSYESIQELIHGWSWSDSEPLRLRVDFVITSGGLNTTRRMCLRPTNLFNRLKSTSTYPRSASRPRALVPRVLPTTGFTIIPETVEEENWGWYTPRSFYPVRIGDVLHSKHQVLYKLGYGTTATIWMCRDLWYVPLSLLNNG